MAYDLSCWLDVKTQTHTEETGGGGGGGGGGGWRKPESLICPLIERIIAWARIFLLVDLQHFFK